MLNYVPHVVDIDKSSNMFGENYKYNLCLVVNCPKQRNTGHGKKVMNMETNVLISVNGISIDRSELDNSLADRLKVLLRVRNRVGFATVRDEEQYSTPLEVTLDLCRVPLATVTDYSDVDQLQGLGDMTVIDYCDTIGKAHDKMIEAVGNDSDLAQAFKDCTLGQLFLIVKEIKEAVDQTE